MAGLQGRVLGGYQLAELIGSGGIAEVYRGRSARAGTREVAIKVIYPEFARQPGFLPNFRRIVDMSAKLASHPHILPMLASGEDNGYLYLVTPYVSGGTLRDWLLHGGRLGASDAAPFFRQLGGAIAYAHSLGVVHGNLKPSNIFLFEGRHILLGDFGLLWDIRQLDMNHVGSGTEAVEYLAPEAFEGHITQASDLYSLGAILFATLIGHPPFPGLKPADIYAGHRHQPVPHLAQIDPSLPPAALALDPIIQRAMAKAPNDRFPSASQLIQAIETALQASPSEPLAGPVPVGSPAVQQAWSLGMETGLLGGPGGPPVPSVNGWANSPFAASPGFAAPDASLVAPINPPFPPLGPSERADAQMEIGRPDFALGNQAAIAQESTERMPAPRTVGEASARADALADLLTAPMAAPAGAEPGPTMRVPAPGLEQQAWAQAPAYPSLLPPGTEWPDLSGDDGQAAMRLPAIRPGNGTAAPGGWMVESAPLGDDRYDPPSASYAGPSYAGPSQVGGYPSGEMPAGAAGEANAAAAHSSVFSATELGLPRLTMPELPDMAPGWNADPGWSADAGAPYGSASAFAFPDGYSAEYSAAPQAGYSAAQAYPGGGQWSGGESAQWSAAYPSYGVPAGAQSQTSQGAYDSAFTNQRVWTDGRTAIRVKRRRIIRNLLIAAIVTLAVLGGALTVYARPDLCPISACKSLNTIMHRYVPSIGGFGEAALLPLSASPTSVRLPAMTGRSATATLTLTNPGAAPEPWQASTDLAWLTVNPATGTLDPNASVALTLTAKPASANPGTYTPTLTISVPGATTSVPVTVVVSAGAHLKVVPPALAFRACNTQQTLTVSNIGDAPLTFSATPSASTTLAVSVSQRTLVPSASTTIVVTLSCQATAGQGYAVNLTSNGGSAAVPVTYGS